MTRHNTTKNIKKTSKYTITPNSKNSNEEKEETSWG
jgi:hypothetical protein